MINDSKSEKLFVDICGHLHENTTENQNLQNEIMDSLLRSKWPLENSNAHDDLRVALEWDLFIPIHRLHCDAESRKLTRTLEAKWLNKYKSIMKHFKNICTELTTTDKPTINSLKDLQLLNQNLESSYRLFS